MERSLHFAVLWRNPGLKRLLALALFISTASCRPLQAQNSALTPSVEQHAQAALPYASFTPMAGSPFGFNTAIRGAAYPGRTTGGFNQFSLVGTLGRQSPVAPLFSMSDSLKRRATAGAFAQFTAATTAPPSLSQYLRGNFNVPINPASNSARSPYQGMFRPSDSHSDLGRPAGSVLFTSPDLGNGVIFSAGTGYGSHSMAGAPAATLGNGAPGAKHSGTSINLKLSF